MPVVALFTWIVTALGGLFLLAIWLIEYDPDFQRAAATRLPVPVVSSHVLLAVVGLVVWIMYLVTDQEAFAWGTVAILAVVVAFGLTMAIRWVGVYRARPIPGELPVTVPADQMPGAGRATGQFAVPPERHFPLPVVIGHGLFALTTVVLVLLTTLGVGGS